MRRAAFLLAVSLAACGPLLGVSEITIDEGTDAGPVPGPDPGDASPEAASASTSCDEAEIGATRPCNTHPGDGVGTCKAGSQTCVATGATPSWSACSGDIGPAAESCDAIDRNCNGIAGIDEPAPPPPAGAMNCTHIFACTAPGRGALYFRTGIGFTNVAGANTAWTAFAPRGDFSDMTNPPGTFRISHDETATKLGPVTVNSACCSGGCPTANTLFDGLGQYYTLP